MGSIEPGDDSMDDASVEGVDEWLNGEKSESSADVVDDDLLRISGAL